MEDLKEIKNKCTDNEVINKIFAENINKIHNEYCRDNYIGYSDSYFEDM